jgi:hypothetical protein
MIKVAICILTRGYKNNLGYIDLILRNRALSRKMEYDPNNFHIDYKIFHEGNISKKNQRFINKCSGIKNLDFIDVSKEFKIDISLESKYTYETKLSKSFSNGYKSMCRFWTDRFMDYTEGYEYVARVDEDCIIKKFPIQEIIKYMKSTNTNYITPVNFQSDDPGVTQGFLEFGLEFMKKNQIKATKLITIEVNPLTNLFLLDAEHYKKNYLFKKYMEEIRKSNGIFVNRWGDHIIWGFLFKMLGENQSLMIRDDIEYLHGSFGQVVNGKVGVSSVLQIILSKIIKFLIRNGK